MTIDGWIHVPAQTAAAGGLYNAQTRISNSRFTAGAIDMAALADCRTGTEPRYRLAFAASFCGSHRSATVEPSTVVAHDGR